MTAARHFFLPAIAVLLLSILFAAPSGAQESISGMHDISELLATAEREFDLENQDAVMLLDHEANRWMPDGRLITGVHRIIWINTDVAIDRYGDHRIPYDDASCMFNLITVRTWRDGQWWDTGPTGMVETLPGRLRQAYDYANMREMMLLHNGIELPCILEVAYSIEDKEPFRAGADGIWMFARREPTVQSSFKLEFSEGKGFDFSMSEGVPDPVKKTDSESGLDIYSWTMGPLPAHVRPRSDDPAAYTPYVSWSTWNNWNEFGNYLDGVFKLTAKPDSSLSGQLDSLLKDTRADAEKADIIANFISERTGFINYPEHYWWPFPREAARTYATAYGHRLDRAVLAAALFNEAGFEARPVFLGSGFSPVDEGIPTLSRMDGPGIWISGQDIEAYYDPRNSVVTAGFARIYGRSIWRPGADDRPDVRLHGNNERSRMEVRIDLTFDSGKDSLTGDGFIYATSYLNPYHRMEGLSAEAKEFLNSSASNIIDGIRVTEYNAIRFDLFNVTAGFKLALKKPEADDFERIPIIIGEPSNGLFEHLPDNVVMYEGERRAPVRLPCPLSQKVELRLDLNDFVPAYMPSDQAIENEAGSFRINTTAKGDRIIISRELNLDKILYPPEEWRALRTLLLADRHERNRTLLLRKKENSGENTGK